MSQFSFTLIVIIFFAAAMVTWLAGVTLAKATDSLDSRFKIGDALGGLILLGIAGSLPEIAVIYSAARDGHIPVIIGNLIGGLSIQTLIIVIFDFALKKKRPLSYLAGSFMLSFETLFAIVLGLIVIIATFIPAKNSFYHINPLSIFILIAWIGGLLLINKARKIPRYNEIASDADPGRKHHERRKVEHKFYAKKSTLFVVLVFVVASILTLAAGVFLEQTGTAIADKLGIGSGIFAATVIALVTSLPEISTGLESIFIGDNQLAVSDIMGGNAFMLVIFLLADIVAQKPTLSYAGHMDLLFAALGVVMMGVYAVSFISKLKKRYFRFGLDSIFVIVLYAVGIYALTFIK